MIDESQLSWMREQYVQTLDRTCALKQSPEDEQRDDHGEVTDEPIVVAENVKYARMSTAGNERLVGASIAALGNYILRFAYDQAIDPTMTVVDAEDGRVFQVIRQLDRSQQIGLRVLATESS